MMVFAGRVPGDARAANTGWRGDGTGRFPDGVAPLQWDQDASVAWKTPTPRWSNASPLLVGDRIVIGAEPDLLLCLDKLTGEILWQRSNSLADLASEADRAEVLRKSALAAELNQRIARVQGQLRQFDRRLKENPDDAAVKAEIEAARVELARWRDEFQAVAEYALPSTHAANGYSSSTPVTDGQRIFMVFGNGVAAAYDLEGNRLWARVVEKPTAGWGHSASPVMAGGRLVLHIRDVHGLDPVSGETVWTVKSRPRWGSVVATEIDGQAVAITANGDMIRAADGHLLAAGLHGLDYCAPIVHDGVVYFIEHGGKAFRLPASAGGDEKPELLWKTSPPKERYYASPIYHEGYIYCINQKGVYSVIDARTGEVLKSENIKPLRRTVYPSVTLLGSRIFLGAECGNVVFLEPGIEMKEVGATRIASFRSTPVADGDRVYLRTVDALLCLWSHDQGMPAP